MKFSFINPRVQGTQQKIAHEIWELIQFVILAALIIIPIRMFVFQPFIVSGESMYPTFHSGDYLIIDEISLRFREPQRGDVIVFRYPEDPKRFFIKRVIGLPGETITFKDRSVYIKNETYPEEFKLDEPYIAQITIPGNISKLTVSEGNYFVLGDNRGFSSDSRSWGELPEENIIGYAGLRLLPVNNISYKPGALKHFEQ